MRELKQLKTKKGRDETGLFLVEGEKFVTEIPANWEILRYVIAKRFADGRDLTAYKRAPIEIVRDSLFDSLADTVTPQGIIAVCKQKHWQLSQLHATSGFILIGEQLNDPGNIGALIRTSAAAGATGIILSKGSGDIYNSKVLRAAAGAALRIPIVTGAALADTISQLKQAGYAVYAAHPRGDTLPYCLDLRGNFCWLVGSESHGLSDEAAGLADACIRLPMASTVESLNASVAGSLLLYEAVRQRLNV
ncbi:MAG: RNA methyltransferase [Defluviitaleaceae bacterium]|nr:RNA methyltransferase [Defluviitaleaceae bacterium]